MPKRAFLALNRVSNRIANVVVRLDDMNGTKRGVDKRCGIELTGTFGQNQTGSSQPAPNPRDFGGGRLLLAIGAS